MIYVKKWWPNNEATIIVVLRRRCRVAVVAFVQSGHVHSLATCRGAVILFPLSYFWVSVRPSFASFDRDKARHLWVYIAGAAMACLDLLYAVASLNHLEIFCPRRRCLCQLWCDGPQCMVLLAGAIERAVQSNQHSHSKIATARLVKNLLYLDRVLDK